MRAPSRQVLRRSLIALALGLALSALTAPCPANDVDTATPDAAAAPSSRQSVVVVIGAPGSDEYRAQFTAWAENWRAAAEQAQADFTLIPGAEDNAVNDRERLQSLLDNHAKRADADVLWLVFIGHGTFDGTTAKFNLRGPDATVDELAAWLAPVKTPVAVIDCTSASAPLLNAAAAKNRAVIAATKNGFELNFARFGQYMSEAIADPRADLDKDDQTSLLEAYLTACRGVAEFYDGEKRLATEHALLDDNGDGLGTPADWFRGVRATQSAKDGAELDGVLAHQWHLVRSDREARMSAVVRERRDALERSIAELRAQKAALSEDAYYERLEALAVELAQLYAGPQGGSSRSQDDAVNENSPTRRSGYSVSLLCSRPSSG
jgi:hypothetical protein